MSLFPGASLDFHRSLVCTGHSHALPLTSGKQVWLFLLRRLFWREKARACAAPTQSGGNRSPPAPRLLFLSPVIRVNTNPGVFF